MRCECTIQIRMGVQRGTEKENEKIVFVQYMECTELLYAIDENLRCVRLECITHDEKDHTGSSEIHENE